MNDQPTADELADGAMNLKAMVAFTGFSRTSLYAAMQTGQLRYFVRGRHRLVPKRILVAWMQSELKPASS